jgi:transcriptional regulator of acetoin/glycerol metabolism
MFGTLTVMERDSGGGGGDARDLIDSMSSGDTLDTSPGWDVRPGSPAVANSAPALFLLFEARQLLEPGCRVMLDPLDDVVVARGQSGAIERVDRSVRLLVPDGEMSRRHFVVRRVAGGWQVEDLGSRNGTFVRGERLRSAALLTDGDVIEAGGSMLMFRASTSASFAARDVTLDQPHGFLPTLSVELEQRFAQVARIAPSNVAVLVRGETGTGKEVLARAIHDASGRRGAFVAVNCGALPRNLIESELFGHRRGAFSGATEDREGLIRRAHHGTLFLDEIAELPIDSQVALLRVLQEGEVRPVGGSDDLRVDVRVIAATHQDLSRRIAAGLFRPDLYGRISGFEVTMPALRDRREDLGLLIAALLPRICAEPERVTLTHGAARALIAYAWPLNIRELEQTLRAAVALSEGDTIGLEHLPASIRDRDTLAGRPLRAADLELRARLVRLLRDTHGNVAAVGRAMNRAPIQIRRWCERLQIDLASFRQ